MSTIEQSMSETLATVASVERAEGLVYLLDADRNFVMAMSEESYDKLRSAAVWR